MLCTRGARENFITGRLVKYNGYDYDTKLLGYSKRQGNNKTHLHSLYQCSSTWLGQRMRKGHHGSAGVGHADTRSSPEDAKVEAAPPFFPLAEVVEALLLTLRRMSRGSPSAPAAMRDSVTRV